MTETIDAQKAFSGTVAPEGADRVLAKPFANADLRRVVQDLLGPA